MIVQACLNGARSASFHPRLPATPAAIVADAVAAISAGASELHVHVRNASGTETLSPEPVDQVIGGLRGRLPGTLVGISTGAWIENDDDRRLAFIETWRELPDYASINLSEPDSPAVFDRLARRGIAVEAGLATPADAERLVALDLARRSLRILVELDDEQSVDTAHGVADGILAVLAKAGVTKPVLIHGAGAAVWSFVERAARQRFSTRIGLEDGATLPDGRVAESNAELVAIAVAIMARR